MKMKLERGLCLAAAVVNGVGPMLLNQVSEGLILAAIGVALALRYDRR